MNNPVENNNPKSEPRIQNGDFHPTVVPITQTVSNSASSASSNSSNSSPEISKEEILKQIFGDAGELLKDFTCAVESSVLLHGRMYVTSRFLCFYSNLFGLEKKIRIPYSHITKLTKENTAMVFPNAIAVGTHRKEYLFRSFWERDDCYSLLQDLVNKAKVKASRHMSAPSGLSSEMSTSKKISLPIQSQGSQSVDNNASTKTETGVENNVGVVIQAKSIPSSSGLISSSSSSSNKDQASLGGNYVEEEETDSESGLTSSGTKEEVSPQTLAELMQGFQDEVTKSKLKISVLTDSLPVSVSEFATLFIEDSAVHPMNKYHESVGDTKVEMTKWSEMTTNLGLGREMKFVKPIPSIKSSTRALKVQRYRRFGDAGIVICSSTRLEDVPAADTFSVEDMIAIKSVANDRVTVEITFEVKFIKSTMFKYMIESSTVGEMTKWLEAFFNHLRTQCTQRSRPAGKRRPTSMDARIPSTSSNDARRRATISLDAGNVSGKFAPEPGLETSENKTDHATTVISQDSVVAAASTPVTTATAAVSSSWMGGFVEKASGMLQSLPLSSLISSENVGKGGKVFWAAWGLLLLTFLFFSNSYRRVYGRLNSLEHQNNQLLQIVKGQQLQNEVLINQMNHMVHWMKLQSEGIQHMAMWQQSRVDSHVMDSSTVSGNSGSDEVSISGSSEITSSGNKNDEGNPLSERFRNGLSHSPIDSVATNGDLETPLASTATMNNPHNDMTSKSKSSVEKTDVDLSQEIERLAQLVQLLSSKVQSHASS